MEKPINERIKLLRSSMGLTQQDFSSLVGITSTQLSRIENLESNPQKSTLRQISNATGVSFEWLCEGKGEMKTQAISIKAHNTSEPWKDEAYQNLKEEVSSWKDRYDRLFQLLEGRLAKLKVA